MRSTEPSVAECVVVERPSSICSGGQDIAASGSTIAWSFFAALTSLPWLLPTHSAPWPTFYQEIFAAGAAVVIAAWTVLHAGRWCFDLLTAAVFSAALIPMLQGAAGIFPIASEAPLISLYIAGFGFMLLIARQAEDAAPGRLIDAVFAGLAIAALVSTGLALAQWLGVDFLGDMLAPMPSGARPAANVGQPNNLATLLVWGLIALWWGHSREQIGPTGAILGAGFLLVGLTLTQSRAGALEIALMAAVAWRARRRLKTSRQTVAFAGLGAWFLSCTWALDPLARLWSEQAVRPMLDPNSTRERLMLLKTVLRAIAEHPWVGYGWNQNTVAHVTVADRYPMHGLIANSHNIVLDFIVWNGVPLALLMSVGACLWLLRTALRAATPQAVLLLLAVGTFSLHAGLELPHVFAYFLVPLAVIVGTLTRQVPLNREFAVPRAAIAVGVLCFGAVFVEMFAEYRRIEVTLTNSRLRAAGIAGAPAYADPHVYMLQPLQRWMAAMHVDPRRGMSDAELGELRQTVTRYPTGLALLRYAQAAAINGQPAEADWALRVLFSLNSMDTVAAAATEWKTLAANGYPELRAIAFPASAEGAAR